MAQLIGVKLSRFDGSPWGFRLQGGKDFGTPLIVQKVNGGSPAEAAGLRAGDSVVRVNGTEVFNLRHKDAQDVIVRAGNSFELTVQRGGSTWKPSVSPVTASIPSPQPSIPASSIPPVTKTSLAPKKQEGPLIGSGHNFSPKPFLNGTGDGSIKSIVNKQYNSPVGIYSEETIAETLSAQAEVLAGGVLGVNFKKNEKNYNAQNSEVFKMVQEADKEPKSPEPVPPRTEFYSLASHAVGGRSTSPRSPTPRLGALGQEESQDPRGVRCSSGNEPEPSSSLESPICRNCDKAIVGVFVRIKDKNLHVECFKCSTCGTSLKNVGYYNINNKLYCDIHAKLVARQNAPAGLAPVTVPPGGRTPAGTISAALPSVPAPGSPSLNSHSSPQPFSACHRSSPVGSRATLRQRPPRPTSGVSYSDTRTLANGTSNGVCGSKTYTSTLTIRTCGEVGSTNGSVLASDSNRSPNRLAGTKETDDLDLEEPDHAPKVGEVCEIFFNPVIDDGPPASRTPKTYTSMLCQPTRLGTSPVNPPSLRPVQAPTGNNIGGPKPFGSSAAPISPPLSSGNTLPRPQSQTAGGAGGFGSRGGSFAGSTAPTRGRGILNQAATGPRVPLCGHCNSYVRGPFITALGQIWCPDHFICVNSQCRRPLHEIGFVEEKGQLHCEYCFERFIAPNCYKCNSKIKGDCLNAIGKHFHPECFNCCYCGKLFGNSPFFLEDGSPYCENDWNELFTTKCFACGFPVEAGDRWVEALNNNYHSQCFNCTMCKKNLEGQSFYAKGGRPFCKTHAR
ncbi:PDZ and LIM domain protein Zasp isoform X6 [Orussus abietinus]|uniref:PDZ and LIM domain protein Zasp isoform X6 n=1 Tax=Orussus abietinus TaxID=222816 RepID=UPI00062655D2|nr:PDZ and LIM domain protein Zasp isoform X6 [Orussus abietinus]